MTFDELNHKIERSDLYVFMKRHEKAIKIIEGLFIIGLLIGINMYVVKDHFIKKQIKERCGYTTSKYECVCDSAYVQNWKNLQIDNISVLNIGYENVSDAG